MQPSPLHETSSRQVAILGLGSMGTTLARLLLRQGYTVTVWNRTGSRAEPLVREGAIQASTAAAAVASSPLIVVCVHDYAASHAILESSEVVAALAGRVVIQLSTGSPQEARDSETWARARAADFVSGAIQAAPSQMGRPDTTLLVSGAKHAFERSEAVLRIFGGNITYLGEDAGAAPTMDLATLSYVYGSVLGFFHGARVCEVEGIPVETFGSIVAAIAPGFGEFLRHEGKVIQSGDFTVTESPLGISVEATERIAQAARTAGINAELPTLVASLFHRASARGYAREEAAALIKVLREPV
jgi:3-hydroxyisobutyrate dehydrogenase-like beta-hydroxyacid dehydrogenase